jgi:hypothetical protein
VLHGSDWYVNPGNYEWWDILYIRAMLPVYCRRAARLLAISRTVTEDLARHAGIDRGKVTVSYAAPSPHFYPNAGTARQRVATPATSSAARLVVSVPPP